MNETLPGNIEERNRVDRTLHESEEKFRSLLEAVPVGIVAVDSFGGISLVNPKVEKMFGYTKSELMGQKLELLLTERFQQAYSAHQTNYESDPRVQTLKMGFDLVGRRKDGSTFPVDVGLKIVKIGNERLAISHITDISDRIKAEELAIKLAAIVESTEDAIIGKTLDGIITSWNRGAEKIYGYTAKEAVGKHISLLLPTDQIAETGQIIDQYETMHVRKDGQQIHVSLTISSIQDSMGNLIGIATIARDITHRKQAEAALQYQMRFEKIITTLSAHFIYLSPEEIHSGVETALQSIGEFIEVDRSYVLLLSDDKAHIEGAYEWHAAGTEARVDANRMQGTPVNIDSWMMKKLMQFETVQVPRITDLPNQAGEEKARYESLGIQSILAIPMVYRESLMGFLGLVSERTEKSWSEDVVALLKVVGEMFVTALQRHRAEEALRHQAFHDELTNLPNRVFLVDRLAQSINRAKQSEDFLFAVLFLDLVRFKVINDSLGHLAGDQLLITIACRLEACLRSKDIAARMGGDEFVILLENIRNVDDAINVARRIQAELARPIDLDGHEVSTAASIGIVLSTMDDYERPAEILRDADVAMYHAKAIGQTHYEIFTTSMRAQALSALHMETELRQAFERDELQVYYQPIVSLTDGHITGVEALLRWNHPQRGLILPAEFIPLAEETGLIVPIGEWVLHTVCLQNKSWYEAGYLSEDVRMSLNLSARQFQQANLPKMVDQVLKNTGTPSRVLELEITEGPAMIKNLDQTMAMLEELSAMGTRIAIDDFGVAYSSLNRLRRFPIDTLKIDRSFIKGIPDDKDDTALTTAIITMGLGLGLTIVAEGVETEGQLEFLRSQRCNEFQGYLFSRPVPADTMTQLFQEKYTLTRNGSGIMI